MVPPPGTVGKNTYLQFSTLHYSTEYSKVCRVEMLDSRQYTVDHVCNK